MEVDIFKVQLKNLDKLLVGMKTQSKQQTKLNLQMDKFNQGINKAKKSADRLLDTFRQVFSVIKSIGFASLMTGGVMGVKGVLAQKEYAKAKTLDLSTHQLKALKYAGGQSQTANRDFLVDLASSLKASLYTNDKAQNWASLGYDVEMLRQLDTIDLLKTFISTVSERGLGDAGQNKNLQDILEGLSDISLGDLKNINPEEIWANYEKGLKLTDSSGDKLISVGKSVNTLITTFDTFVTKIQASLAPAFSELLDSISNGLNKLSNSKEFKEFLQKISKVMKNLSGSASEYITKLTKSIPDLFRDMKIVFLQIISALGSVMQVFTIGMNDNVNRMVKRADKALWQAEDEKYRDLHKRMNEAKNVKDYLAIQQELMDFTENGDRLTKENKKRLYEDILRRNEEFNKQLDSKNQSKGGNTQQVVQPINITVHNDPDSITQTHTLTNSINVGGWGNGGNQ